MPDLNVPAPWSYAEKDAIRLYRMGVPETQIIGDLLTLFPGLSTTEAAVLYGRAKDMVDYAREQATLPVAEQFFGPTMPALPEVPAGRVLVELEFRMLDPAHQYERRGFLRDYFSPGLTMADLNEAVTDLIRDLINQGSDPPGAALAEFELITVARSTRD